MVKCEACGKKEEELGARIMMMQCARCFDVSYCDGECQRAHWAEHRARCKERAAELAAYKAKKPTLVGDASILNAAALRCAADADNLNNSAAMMDLGVCYQQGTGGVDKDAAEGVRWFTRATEAHNPPVEAYYNLASCYYLGEGVRKNLSEAARLYRIAAEMGDADAQDVLGQCLQRGEGVQYNPVEAFMWKKRAADTGHAEAQCSVGYALQNGLGVRENKAAAVVFYYRAAYQGNETAMHNLGVCYRDGTGVPQDVPQAVAWFTRARDAGYPVAAARLAEIAPHLTPAERAAARQLLAAPPTRPLAAIAPAVPRSGGAPTLADVLTMGTGALKRLLQGRGVDTSGIIEKAHLVELALAAIGAAPL